MIDLDRIPVGRLAVLADLYDRDRDRDTSIVDFRPHERGYWPAQAAGFALLRRIDAAHADLSTIPTYLHDLLADEAFDNPSWFDAEFAIRVACVDAAAHQALSIALAQGRDDQTTRDLAEGLACAGIWNQITDDQRLEIRWQPNDLELAQEIDDIWFEHPDYPENVAA
jgi:hypothetical protein